MGTMMYPLSDNPPLSTPNPTLEDVCQALALSGFDATAAWQRMAPRPRSMQRPPNLEGEARNAGVLILLYPLDDVLAFVLTRRTETVAFHKGEISLPGGAAEPGDGSPLQTALRETCEELAVCQGDINPLGGLTPFYLGVSDFRVHPFVGTMPARPAFHPDPIEVAGLLEMPLPTLLNDEIKAQEQWHLRGQDFDVPFYRVSGHIIWGATAILLSEFECRLRAVLGLTCS